MLAPVIPLLDKAGHHVTLMATGPAARKWKEFDVSKIASGVGLATARKVLPAADLIITGTSFVSDFERDIWEISQVSGAPSIAVIDTWGNFRRRFERTDNGREIRPNAVGVIDEWCADEFHGLGFSRDTMHVVGHPHLQTVVDKVTARRASRKPCSPRVLVFVSEPLKERFHGEQYLGYDQFEVFALVASSLSGIEDITLKLKLHPAEEERTWREWLQSAGNRQYAETQITSETPEDLLVQADGVIGMESMMLLEATMAGVPALAVQPGRRPFPNPIFDRFPTVILAAERSQIPYQIQKLMARIKANISHGTCHHGSFPFLHNAIQRLYALIEHNSSVGTQ